MRYDIIRILRRTKNTSYAYHIIPGIIFIYFNINVYYDMILVFIFDIYTFAVFFKHSPTKNSYNIYEVIYYTKRSYFVFYYIHNIIYRTSSLVTFFFLYINY